MANSEMGEYANLSLILVEIAQAQNGKEKRRVYLTTPVSL